MTNRTFYRTVISVEVLSEEPVDFIDLAHVHEAITNDCCSGSWEVVSAGEVDGATMAKLLIAQGSDPAFFELTDDGEDDDCKDESEGS